MWAERLLKVPVIDHWWQTETAWCIAGNPVGLGRLPVKYGSATVPMPGYHIDVVDEHSKPVPANTIGSIVVKLPLPPACLPTLWQADERFRESYLAEFPGYYKTADAGMKDEDGYVHVMGRTDDIINVAGHRLSTGAMEEVLSGHQDVAECAVIGIADALKGEVPCGFVVLKTGVNRAVGDIEQECVGLIREKIGPVAAFKLAIAVGRAAEDPLGQDSPRHDEEDRRRRALDHAGDHRRSRDPRRDRDRAEGKGSGDSQSCTPALRSVALGAHDRAWHLARTASGRAKDDPRSRGCREPAGLRESGDREGNQSGDVFTSSSAQEVRSGVRFSSRVILRSVIDGVQHEHQRHCTVDFAGVAGHGDGAGLDFSFEHRPVSSDFGLERIHLQRRWGARC